MRGRLHRDFLIRQVPCLKFRRRIGRDKRAVREIFEAKIGIIRRIARACATETNTRDNVMTSAAVGGASSAARFVVTFEVMQGRARARGREDVCAMLLAAILHCSR